MKVKEGTLNNYIEITDIEQRIGRAIIFTLGSISSTGGEDQ